MFLIYPFYGANAEPGKWDLKKTTFKILDGSATPNEVTIKFDEGTFTATETTNHEYIKDRGALDTVRAGDEEPLGVSFEGRFSSYKASSGNNITPYEILTQTGGAASYVSTGAICEPYAVDLQISNIPSCTDGTDTVQDEVVDYPDFRQESIAIDLKAGTISVSGKCNVRRPTITRQDPS